MSLRHPLLSATTVGALALVSACSTTTSHRDRVPEAPMASAPVYGEYGQVTSIEVVPVASRPSGAGAILGAIVGGVVGNQFGSGSGRALTTIGGAVAGGVAGNAIEQRTRREDEVYRVSVRFNDGSVRDFDYQQVGGLRVGDRVRLVDGQLHMM